MIGADIHLLQNGGSEEYGALFRAVSSTLSTAIDKHLLASVTDPDGMIVAVSPAFCELSGYASSELIGRNHNLLRHPGIEDDRYARLWSSLLADGCWRGELKNRTKSGDFYWVMTEINAVKDDDGSTIGYIAVHQDITAFKAQEMLSITDPLTRAYNRRYYEQILPKELARARRDRAQLAFMMVDADHFKRYNDTYGHQAGDGVIRAIVDGMRAVLRRPSDSVFRLGGEEFAALYRVKSDTTALQLAEKIRQVVYDDAIEHSGNAPDNRVTVSIGLTVISPEQKLDMDDIYKYSDIALYHAKAQGRNRVAIHREEAAEIDLF